MTDKREEALNDLVEAFYGLRRAFRKHNIPVPDHLSFSDGKDAYDAMRTMAWISQGDFMYRFAGEQCNYDKTEIVGFKIHHEVYNETV